MRSEYSELDYARDDLLDLKRELEYDRAHENDKTWYCTECGQQCDVEVVNDSFSFEFCGEDGIERDINLYSDCCGAIVSDEQPEIDDGIAPSNVQKSVLSFLYIRGK